MGLPLLWSQSVRLRGMSCEAKLFSDFGRGRGIRWCNVRPSSCRLCSLHRRWATDSSERFTWSASAASAFTTAFIVLLSLPRSSSLCATKFGFLPILFNLPERERKHLGRSVQFSHITTQIVNIHYVTYKNYVTNKNELLRGLMPAQVPNCQP